MAVAKRPSTETMQQENFQNQAMAMLNCAVQDMNIQASNLSQQAVTTQANTLNTVYYGDQSGGTLWNYWQNQYYPYVIRESYPVYIQERAMDKGKQAFEILKALMDKDLVKIDKVKDFIEAMDTLLKTL